MDNDAGWLRALSGWLANTAGSATEAARALTIADRLEEQSSKLEATEKERLDLLARVGYAEGAGGEGLRRWELAEERARAAESRLEAVRKILEADLVTSGCATCHELGRLLSVSGVERCKPKCAHGVSAGEHCTKCEELLIPSQDDEQ